MSRSVYAIERFQGWLREASFANVSKNKERKRLLDDYRQCFKPVADADLHQTVYINNDLIELIVQKPFVVSNTSHATLLTFFLKDGKGDQLKDDEILSFVTTLEQLTEQFEDHLRRLQILAKESEEEEEKSSSSAADS